MSPSNCDGDSALECLIYLGACFQPVSLAAVSFPSGGQQSLCGCPKLSPGPSLGAGDKAKALDHAARPWGSVLRT